MRKTVMLVEDNMDDEELIVRSLKNCNLGNDIYVVRDGQEALDKLLPPGGGAPKDLPIVVLLDLRLPKLDGFEVLQRLRADERTALLPVVILTSSDEGTDRLRGYKSGANSFVHKPVEFDEFADAIRQLGLYWLVINKPAYG